MNDVKLLPLPASRNTVLIRGEGHSGEISASPCEHYFDPDTVLDYARACVAHATAAKDAEIESLRGDVEKWKRPCQEFLDKTEWVQHTGTARELGHHRADILRDRIKQAEARAERLVEAADYAARFILDFSALTYSPHSCERAAERLKEALRPFTATQQEADND